MRPTAALPALILLGISASAPMFAQGPDADWRTVETAHFRVHYPAPFEAWARHAAGAIEEIHARVTGFVGYTPARRIDVVIADPTGDWNGIAIPFLDRPEIVLWTTPPSSGLSDLDFTDWMELLTTHELAHIVHLARPKNRSLGLLSKLSPAPFGPLAVGSPRWVIEGYATLVEGALTGSGRPASSLRAMVLRQFAIEGKLPSYGELDGTRGWLRGSMAYLVGSAYLEWLAPRGGKDSLPRLWRRMASRRGGGFAESFRGVFGESPRDLYDRFSAEVTAAALEEERRLEKTGLVEGELWQRLEGGTSAPSVSPDGRRIVVRRDPRPGESALAIWEIAPGAEELREVEERRRREEELTRDPNEVADVAVTPRPRRPRWTLPRADGFSAADPRWMPGGGSVLFARRAPDADGVLRWDLYEWRYETGRVERRTRLADVTQADPSPDGRWAVAVQGRFGATRLVRVDLATGDARPIPTDAAGEAALQGSSGEAWPVWSHPRISPDGRAIAALRHAAGRWRLVTLSADGGAIAAHDVPGTPVGPPAWSPDGSRLWVATDASGIWNLAELDLSSGELRARTRVTGGAFSPAPAPDERSVYYLELTGKGVNLRRLDLAAAPPAAALEAVPEDPILRPAPVAPPPLAAAPVPAARAYDAWASTAVRGLANFSLGPSGNSVQVGADGDDVLGRFHWLAAGSIGDAAGPRGGSIAAAYRGLPVEISAQLFSSLERPGGQELVRRPELDEERRGGYAGLAWGRPFTGGRVRIEAGGGGTRIEALARPLPPSRVVDFWRVLGSARAALALRRTRGRSGVGLDVDAAGAVGSTDGAGWTAFSGGVRAIGIAPFASLSATARWGSTGGSPSAFDLFAIGGAPSAIVPPGLEGNRVESPGLPLAVQLGRRFERYRAELSAEDAPIAAYADWIRAWDRDAPKPDPVRVLGLELRLERLIPIELDRPVAFRIGVARISSDEPRLRSTRGYASLVYRQ